MSDSKVASLHDPVSERVVLRPDWFLISDMLRLAQGVHLT